MFLAVNAPNFMNYELSSKECFIFNGLMGFLVLEWEFFDDMKVVKCLILVVLLEVGIEVILVILGGFEFLSRYMDGTDSLVFAAGCLP